MVIIVTAMAVQLIGRYFAANQLVIGGYFYVLWVILRIVVPLMVIYGLGIPFKQLGLGLPQIDPYFKKILVGMAVLLCVIFAGIYFYQGYFSSYAGSFHGGGQEKLQRFINFMVFTSSTLTGWEFLHRGFLLMGLSYVLSEREKIDPRRAVVIAVAVAWVFEVVFHFIKPMLEPIGLLVGSPILSYIALRTRSIWIAFLGHLMVEVLFIASLIFR